jgi:hypothetical protein
MPGSEIKFRGDSADVKVTRKDGTRSFAVEPGRRYRVVPFNPLKKKGAGREVEFLGFKEQSPYTTYVVARVRYLDNRREGTAEIAELVPLD